MSDAVKCLWPVGGALMQCFKAPLEVTAAREGGRERGTEQGEVGAAGTDERQASTLSPQLNIMVKNTCLY